VLRPKDVEFCRALLDRGYVDRHVLHDRVETVPWLTEAQSTRINALIDRRTQHTL